MKRLLIYIMMVLVCFTVYSVAWSDSLSLSAKGNEKAPLPDNVSYRKPADDVPKNIQNLLGRWEGNWGGQLNSYMIFEEVTADSARVIYGWGTDPSFGITEGGYNHNTASLMHTGDKSSIDFKFAMINGTLSADGKTIEAVYNGRLLIKMKKIEDPLTVKRFTPGADASDIRRSKESEPLSLNNTIIKEKAPFPGYLYRPKDNAAHPGILILHGSDGGNADFGITSATVGEKSGIPELARIYASRGYVTYALCYFDCMHHEGYADYPPDELKNIDLLKITYKAFLWLKNSDYVKNKKVAIYGRSRGAEQALLFASMIGKHKDDMNLVAPDAIVAVSPSDFAFSAFTKEQADFISNGDIRKGKKFPTNNDSAWIFAGEKIKPNTPIDIQYFKGPTLITYFTTDSIWGPSIHCENLVKRYSDNNIPYELIPYNKNIDVTEALNKARNNMHKNIIINFDKEKGHCFPREQQSVSLMIEVTNLFLKTHLGD